MLYSVTMLSKRNHTSNAKQTYKHKRSGYSNAGGRWQARCHVAVGCMGVRICIGICICFCVCQMSAPKQTAGEIQILLHRRRQTTLASKSHRNNLLLQPTFTSLDTSAQIHCCGFGARHTRQRKRRTIR